MTGADTTGKVIEAVINRLGGILRTLEMVRGLDTPHEPDVLLLLLLEDSIGRSDRHAAGAHAAAGIRVRHGAMMMIGRRLRGFGSGWAGCPSN